MRNVYARFLTCLALAAVPPGGMVAVAQNGPQPRVTTAVPFLRISPDARGAGMGDAGVASPADVHSIYWNPAKLAFVPEGKGLSFSYAPWLQKMAPNMWISQVTGFFTLPDGRQSLGASLVYFNQGTIYLKDNTGQGAGSFSPREVAFTTTYSRRLGERFSLAANLRYVYSNLFGAMEYGLTGDPGHGLAGDVGAFFQTDPETYRNQSFNLALGASLSNLGTQMNYGAGRYFMPTTLRLGTGLTYRFGEHGRFTWVLDAQKLMVPSPPRYELSADGGAWIMTGGRNPDRNYFSSVFGSFTDAPNGLAGEWREVIVATGVEVRTGQYFTFRGGYFRESVEEGDRKYFTAGAGLHYRGMGLDLAYLVPQQQNHPLAETVRLTLSITPEAGAARNPLVYNRPRGAGERDRFRGPYPGGRAGAKAGRTRAAYGKKQRYPYTRSGTEGLAGLFGKKSPSLSYKKLKQGQKKRERRTRRTLRQYGRSR